MKLSNYALGLVAGLMTAATGAMASERAAPAAPPQTHDIRSAELPPMPGLYGSIAYGQRKVSAIHDTNGDAVFPDTDATETVKGLGLLYVMPEPVGSGRLAFYGVTTFQDLDGTLGGGTPALNESNRWVDAVVGAVWSKAHYQMPEGPPMGPPPGYAYSFGLQATIPGGDGSLGSLVVSPHAAFTYRTKPILLDGTEFSARLTYNHVTTRDSDIVPGTRYKDGDYIALDFAITERYKMVTFGLAGTYMKQIEDDRAGAGYPVGLLPFGGGRMEELAIGGVVNIDLGPTSALKVKYTKSVVAKNISKGNLLGIVYVRKF